MGFLVFILVNAALFVRPAELLVDRSDTLPQMEQTNAWGETVSAPRAPEGIQIYQFLIILCLGISFLQILKQLSIANLVINPLIFFVLALLPVIFLSLILQGDILAAISGSLEFAKVLVYYLLLISLVNTPERLKIFLFWITLFAGAVTLLAVLNYHGIIQLANLQAMEDRREDGALSEQVYFRLCGTGIFNDPNDFCLLLIMAIPLTTYWLIDGENKPAKIFWFLLLLLFVYALALTKSRGGLLAMLAGILFYLYTRFNPRIAITLMFVLLPAAFLVFAGRQTDVFTTGDTAQGRFQLWDEGFLYLKRSPLFGVGFELYDKSGASQVAHNSFVHCFGELGLLGGTLFLGMFAYSMFSLLRLSRPNVQVLDTRLEKITPCLLAMTTGYVILMMSLSRSYIVPTYMMLGLVTTHLAMAKSNPPVAPIKLSMQLLAILGVVAIVFLALVYFTLRIVVRY